MAVERVVLAAAKEAGRLADDLAPQAAETCMNVVNAARQSITDFIPAQLKQGAHIGSTNGIYELVMPTNTQVLRARAFEAASKSPYENSFTHAFPEVAGTISTDTLVVGGGMNGLSIAETFAAHGIKTTLVDAGTLGSLTSARGTGIATRAGDATTELVETLGPKTFEEYATGMWNAKNGVIDRASKFGDDIDFRRADSHQISYDAGAVDDWMLKEYDGFRPFDKELSFATGDEASSIFEHAKAVMTFRNEAHFNPRKYVGEMARNANYNIFENSEVYAFELGKAGQAVTALTRNGGRIEANNVIFATGTGGHFLPHLDKYVEPVQCFAALVKTRGPVKLNGSFFDDVGPELAPNGLIRNRSGEGPFTYFREFPSPNGDHILFGGADKMLSEVPATRTAALVRKQLEMLFPGSKIEREWNGLLDEGRYGLSIIDSHRYIPQLIGTRATGGSGLVTSQMNAYELLKYVRGGQTFLSAANQGMR